MFLNVVIIIVKGSNREKDCCNIKISVEFFFFVGNESNIDKFYVNLKEKYCLNICEFKECNVNY